MLASAFTLSSARLKELDVRLYLPMDEGAFDMVIKDDVVPEFLASRTGGPPSRTYVSEFGHLLRITVIYSQIMGYFSERSEASRRRNRHTGDMTQSFESFQKWDAALEVTYSPLCLTQSEPSNSHSFNFHSSSRRGEFHSLTAYN
jgi:hypothetical protein